MRNYIIIIPTHKRHEYLHGKIKFYASFPCEVYICDSSPDEFIISSGFPENIHYIWCPDKGFYQKVMCVLDNTDASFYNLTPDDDFLDLETLEKCNKSADADKTISLCVGKQVFFNKPYDGKFYIKLSANRLNGAKLDGSNVQNAKNFGSHYQNILWSFFRKDVIYSAFRKLVSINPENGNFIELTLALEACVGGHINVVDNPLNYREYSKEVHWGTVVEEISMATLASNPRMKANMESLLSTYEGENKAVAEAFMSSYLKVEKRWSLKHIFNAIMWRLFKLKDEQEVPVNRIVETIITHY